MQIVIESTSIELDDAMRDYIEVRIRFALTRYCPRIKRIVLHVQNAPRPAGGFDACCNICVTLIPYEKVEVEAHDTEIRAAVARGVEMTGRAVRRKVEQSNKS